MDARSARRRGVGAVGGALIIQHSNSTLIKYGVPVTTGAGGAVLGAAIGCSLNDVNKEKAENAVAVTAMSGKPQIWDGSEPGVSGETRVISNKGIWRTIKQIVTLSDGTQKTEQVKACKSATGWEVAS